MQKKVTGGQVPIARAANVFSKRFGIANGEGALPGGVSGFG
jgi:hypothetical protein